MKPITFKILALLFLALFVTGAIVRLPPPVTDQHLIAHGYGGPIELDLTLTNTGKISGIKVLQDEETSSYITKIGPFLEQFIGKTALDPLLPGKDIDAITHATITSHAIADAVRSHLTSRPVAPKDLPLSQVLAPIFLMIIATLSFIRRNNALRWAALVGGFVYFGMTVHTMFSVIQPVQAMLGHSPTWQANPLWWMLMILGVGATFIIGRVYCGNLCPFAIVQELLFRLALRRKTPMRTISPVLDRRARVTKYILLFAIMTVCFILNSAAAANMEPFITLFSGHGTKLAWALLALMLILSIFHFRFWCTYLCPAGALSSLGAAFSLNKITTTERCTTCGICTTTCPSQAITTDVNGKPVIDMTECLACARCLRACPVNALKIGHKP